MLIEIHVMAESNTDPGSNQDFVAIIYVLDLFTLTSIFWQ